MTIKNNLNDEDLKNVSGGSIDKSAIQAGVRIYYHHLIYTHYREEYYLITEVINDKYVWARKWWFEYGNLHPAFNGAVYSAEISELQKGEIVDSFPPCVVE